MAWTYISELDAFTIYHQVREEAQAHTDDASLLPSLGHAIAGAVGSAVSNVVVYPVDLVVTRLQVQHKKPKTSEKSNQEDDTQYADFRDAVQKIYHNEGGISAFYSGIVQDTFKTVTDSFLFFLAYNMLLRLRKNSRGASDRGVIGRLVDEVGVGMVAGALVKGFTMPLQQVITRKQTAAMASASASSDKKPHELGQDLSVASIMRNIYKTKGLQGFWSGYSATLILTLNPSLTMSVDSFLQRLLVKGDQPHPALTFLLAATGKAVASSTMYPFSLAKTRAQAAAAESSAEGKSSKNGNVLTTISRIAREEGIGALYSGLGGDVFKGFFSHGLTMLVKQRIHGVVIQFYFLLLERLKARKNGASLIDTINITSPITQQRLGAKLRPYPSS